MEHLPFQSWKMNDCIAIAIAFFLVLLDHCPLQFVSLPVLLSYVKDHEKTPPIPLLSFFHAVTIYREYLKVLHTSNNCHSKAFCHIMTQIIFLLQFFSSINHQKKSFHITHFMQSYKNSDIIAFLLSTCFFYVCPRQNTCLLFALHTISFCCF